ncbi:hypothetical protein D7322_23665 [Sphingobacterium puteale]|uniref:Uncharacterized protein n=1 Tax=Sphingobacterium puteale TaxID=2420510 RepID=A0A420VSC8_9SPHI|nr:hypothetical protein D7322_23665 [Sphingobacterium puteale]
MLDHSKPCNILTESLPLSYYAASNLFENILCANLTNVFFCGSLYLFPWCEEYLYKIKADKFIHFDLVKILFRFPMQ